MKMSGSLGSIEAMAFNRALGKKGEVLTQIKEQLHRIGLSRRRIPSLFNCMEGVMPGYGRFFKYITRKFDECGNRETALKNEITCWANS